MVSLILSEVSVSWDALSSFAGWCPVGKVGRGCTDGSVSSVIGGRNEESENTTPVILKTQTPYHLDQRGGSNLAHSWLWILRGASELLYRIGCWHQHLHAGNEKSVPQQMAKKRL